MPEATFHFPRRFLWGTATSSHQVEGNNHNNNWSAWEQEDGRIIDGHKAGLACDWWSGRWREDFDRAAESGQNAHRLSIEWSRVQPSPDRWDESALDHYRQMLRGLNDRGMATLVTLHHFTDPLWLVEKGGWENETVVELFVAYVRRVVEALKVYSSTWCTINDPNVYASLGYMFGLFPPGKKEIRATFQVMTNMLRAHAAAYHAIHEIQPKAQVGLAVNYRGFNPYRPKFPLDKLGAQLLSNIYNEFFPRSLSEGVLRFITKRIHMPEIRRTQDFLGINYYTEEFVAFDLRGKDEFYTRRFYTEDADLSPSGFIANQPEGFYCALQWGRGFGIPMIVTENGVEDSGDIIRSRYLTQHIRQLWRGVNFNYPIRGYFHRSLVDNFEWERGWSQRFGLWQLDVDSQARRKRPSADLYAAICVENGLSSEMVKEYAPEIFEEMFPG